MRSGRRLAVVDRGEPAVRVLTTAAATTDPATGEPLRTVAVSTVPRSAAWWAREAGETLVVDTHEGDVVPAGELGATLVAAGADAVWLGLVPCADRAQLAEECERAGILVIGPDATTIRSFCDPARLAALGSAAGVPVHGGGTFPEQARRLEVDVLRDAAGTVWALGLREVTVLRDTWAILSELPATGIPDATVDAMEAAARALVEHAGYRGSALVHFALGPDGSFAVTSVDTDGRATHTGVEERTGAGILGIRLRVALGEALPPTPPHGEGCTVEARLLAHDPDRGYAPTGGRVEVLSLPVGTGVRVDSGLRVGDVVDARLDPVVATVTSWGRDRAQAIARLRRALERTSVVLSGGATNRTGLIAMLGAPAVLDGPPHPDWYAEQLASGGLVPEADPVAVVAAAIEVYDADLALAQRSFRASAERGRPEHPERVGVAIDLAYRGGRHRLRVDRTAPDRYRVHDGVRLDVLVDVLSRFERRLLVAGRTRRVVAVTSDDAIRLEIDGVAHTVTREDGVVVRAPAPALVCSLLVAVGDRVTAGQPVATLESMKMTSTLSAPLTGTVTSLPVLPNQQVEQGDPLMRVKSAETSRLLPVLPTTDGGPDVDLATLLEEGDAPPSADVFDDLTAYLLGFDLDPAAVKALRTAYRSRVAASDPGDPQLLAREDAFLDLFADIGSLYRPRTEAESLGDADEVDQGSTQEYVLEFLRWLDADRVGLPSRFRQRLERVLSRYGVDDLADRARLERATFWLFRAFSRVPELADLVTELLGRRLQNANDLLGRATAADRVRLERLVRATQGRQPAVADAARDVVYHWFDEPVLSRVVAETEAEMRDHLAELAADPTGIERADRIGRLVWCPQPMRSMLLGAWLGARDDGGAGASPDGTAGVTDRGTAFRRALLETYLRRFYRMRDLHGLDFDTRDGLDLAYARYELDGLLVHVVAGYLPIDDLTKASRAVARHLAEHAGERDVVVDLVVWRQGARQDIDVTAAEAAGLLEECEFGRALHRLDLTITSLEGGGPERDRTQHVTFRSRPDGAGFVEDTIYRNLHPMLGKRLDLWRLSNFELTRLPSPEDVYVFDGVAKDNPRDHRLFALAEVRDLTPVRDPATGRVSYPRLGRSGLAALAAMRSAMARYPSRERPAANRLVVWVRPTWHIPREEWRDLAMTYEGLARGASLEKVVLHVTIPETDRHGRRVFEDRIVVLEGLGAGGPTIRMRHPGPNPVRTLTPYAQKVLTASRFGTPYPYEIVRMLTPAEGDASPFPPGSFEELDLGVGDELVPVDREPGGNTAHVVVGLLTNRTAVHPDGMTRVAILADPTQGLGNLAEPECRRVNAALALALERGIPVEWYAVSSGALIAMDSGTENMDWIALTLRRLIEYTQAGGEVNIVITGITVGGQPYWNAEATMLMHTKGILVMTPASTMVLTGKQALDFSGAVSADDNQGIGGFDRVMGPNGQAQYWAPSFPEACALLLRHYDFTYVVPGERFPRRRPTADPVDRDVRTSPHAALPESRFTTVGDVFDAATNPERKLPFDMRSVMRAVADADVEPLERWRAWQDADTAVVWDGTVGGIPVCLIGIESHTVQRKGFVPSYGPPTWTSGTLFPQSSRKLARAVNAASGNRPLVVLANLSGFDGSPESMRNWQLEYGAEIGRAVTNFDGPIVFVVVSRYHGGAFVVFSKALTDSMEIAAVEGSFASVIGGAPAAATVFAREVKRRVEQDPRVAGARADAASASGPGAAALRARAARVVEEVRSQKLHDVADEFDAIHTIERALRVGSVDRIIPASTLRPYVVDALERGMARTAGRQPG
ncbi:biotin carboxylase N-terminal domain-containing protein [Fodinibacter luteus]|uniref:biotin carboxylase n=1 Tax=Fodinibacter luteus TaxID=552064 RepID=A0ABP8JXU1_9MICO